MIDQISYLVLSNKKRREGGKGSPHSANLVGQVAPQCTLQHAGNRRRHTATRIFRGFREIMHGLHLGHWQLLQPFGRGGEGKGEDRQGIVKTST